LAAGGSLALGDAGLGLASLAPGGIGLGLAGLAADDAGCAPAEADSGPPSVSASEDDSFDEDFDELKGGLVSLLGSTPDVAASAELP